MSLLDFKMPGLDTAEGQGIMAAALSLLQAQKMPGQRGLAGALGGAGQQYMQTSGQARQQAMQSKLQGAQLAQYEALNKERERKFLEEQAAAAERKRVDDVISRAGRVPMGLGAGLPADNGLPPEMQIGQVPALRQPGKIDFEHLYKNERIPLDRLKELQSASEIGKPKIKNIETLNINGKPMKVGIDEFGQQVAQIGMEWKPLEFKDFGGDVRSFDPANPDAGFKSVGQKSMTFGDKIAAANLDLSRKKFTYQKDQDAAPKASEKPMTPLQETKYRTQIAKDNQAANSVIQNMDDVIDSITAVKTSKGLDRATGLYAYAPSVPNSDAAGAEVRLQNLEGKITNLGKAAASASGAMGPMAVQEWKIVRDMVAAIDPKKGKKALLEQLDLAENAAKGAAQRIRDGYEKHYSADFEKYPQFADLNAPKDRTPKPDAMPTLPPAQQHKGRTIRDTATGKMLKSNGMTWVEVQ